jgi:hypothetical protein
LIDGAVRRAKLAEWIRWRRRVKSDKVPSEGSPLRRREGGMGREKQYSRDKKEEDDQLFHSDGSLLREMTSDKCTAVD